MPNHTSKKKLLGYLNQRTLFWLLYLLLISGIVFSFPNGLLLCEKSPGTSYCEEPLGGVYFVFPWFYPWGLMATFMFGMPIWRGFYYLFYKVLDLGWEFPMASQPYNERISTLPLVGWLILLLIFYIYAKFLFWIMKSIFYVIYGLIKRMRSPTDRD